MKQIKQLPRCPRCKRKRTVGQVNSVIEKIYRTGRAFNCCKAFYCSECLVEWGEDGNVREPMLA